MDDLILWNANLIFKENPALIAILETWLKEKDRLKMQNYEIIRKDRPEKTGGLAFV